MWIPGIKIRLSKSIGLAVGTFMNQAISLALSNVFSTSSNQILHSRSVLAKAPAPRSGPCNTQNTDCFHMHMPQTPVPPPYGLRIRCLLFPVKHALPQIISPVLWCVISSSPVIPNLLTRCSTIVEFSVITIAR